MREKESKQVLKAVDDFFTDTVGQYPIGDIGEDENQPPVGHIGEDDAGDQQ